jgi:DNA-binding XRE family transcriptional regulator
LKLGRTHPFRVEALVVGVGLKLPFKQGLAIMGSKLRPVLRATLGIGVRDLADMLEISRTTLFRIETEDRELTPAACLMIQYLRSYASA